MSAAFDYFPNEVPPVEAAIRGLFLSATYPRRTPELTADISSWQECAANAGTPAPKGVDIHVTFYPTVDELEGVKRSDIQDLVAGHIAARGYRTATPLGWIITDDISATLVVRLPYFTKDVDETGELISAVATEIAAFLAEEFGHQKNHDLRQQRILKMVSNLG